jgi:hypothetical protein
MQDRISILSLWNGSRTTLNLFAAVLIFAAFAWASDEPWKGKPYQQWTEKDLERIFAYSPWSLKSELTRTWLPLKAEELPQMIAGGVRKLPKGLEQSDEGRLGAEVNFNVYWMSSRVMRQASARQGILKKQTDEAKTDGYVNQPLDEYQIVIQGEDMVPFVRKDEKFFQANAYLQLRKSKQKIYPSHVRYERDKDGILVTAAVFFFPKKTASGDPVIAADEKSVEFTCQVEGSTLRVAFEPQKMVDQKGSDL